MLNNLSVKMRLIFLIAFMTGMMGVIGLVGLKGMNDSNEGLRTVYVDRAVPLDQLAEIMDLNADTIIRLHIASLYDSRLEEKKLLEAPIISHFEKIEQNSTEAQKIWGEYMATFLTPEEKKLAQEYEKIMADFRQVMLATFNLFKENKFLEANSYLIQNVDPKFALLNEKVDQLKTLQVTVAKEEFDKASKDFAFSKNLSIGIMLLAIILALGIGYFIIQNLYSILGAEPSLTVALATHISKGKLDVSFDVKPDDQHSILYSLKTIQDSFNALIAALRAMAAEHQQGWISKKIDASQFPGTYGEVAQEVNDLVNGHISVKMQVVKVISEYAKGNFAIDMDRMPGEKAKITEAIDNVKTTLLDISNEIKMLTDAGVKGDFSQRGDTRKFDFMFRDIIHNINLLLETCDTGLNDVSRVTQALAKGDLTQVITRDYPGTFGEMKQNVNLTIDKLNEVFAQIFASSNLILSSSQEIASGNNDLSQRAEEQAASLEQTASSMEELTSSVKKNADYTQQANQTADTARELAEKGGKVVDSAIRAMQEINDSSNKIAAIIGVIDEIAFQTNLLALNASVEAARAGEHGRGFSVVATEVRNLAQRSATAAKESKELIQNSIQKVRSGSELVNETGKSLAEIVTGVNKVGSIISEIASSSIQQSSGIEQVNQAVSQMDEITQQNAALAEEAAAASISMDEQTRHMTNLLAFFKLKNASGTLAPSSTAPVVTLSNKEIKPKSEHLIIENDDDWNDF